MAILQEGAAGRPAAELLRTHGISAATYYAWKAKYGGLSASELKRMYAGGSGCAISGCVMRGIPGTTNGAGECTVRCG